MTLNLLKTMEIVFHKPNVSHDLLPLIMPSVSWVVVKKLLGVYLRHDLNSWQQVESVVPTCNQRLCLLAQLKTQEGLGISALDSVFKAIVLNEILYTLPIYIGYLTEVQRHTLQRVLHRANSGLYPLWPWSRYASRGCSLWPPCVADADIIFLPCGFYLSVFFARLISAVADWMSTILWHMMWP